jgi:lipoprotein-anchoring transpeptidase ErfK/SrfK
MGQLRAFAGVAGLFIGAFALVAVLMPPQAPVKHAAKPAIHKKIAAKPLPKPAQAVTVNTHLPDHAVKAVPLPPQTLTIDPAMQPDAAKVAARLVGKLPRTLTPYFDVYLYVSKAAEGAWAQRLFIFRKNGAVISFEESFPVSTGREQDEQYFTATPTGLFELDANRFMPMAYSAKWNDAAMPWSMFLNYAYRTDMTGVALHAAVGARELRDLGHRASGGCVRLPLEKVDALFHRFRAEERGQVPVFSFDEARGTTNVDGIVAGDGAGRVYLADGVRVLVVIEDYSGDPAGTPLQS